MNKLLILTILISNFSFGQRHIQHDPERIFNKLIGKSTTEYAKENNLKKVTFYRDTILSSSIEFDKKGNFIRTVGMENNAVRESTYKWDDQDRVIETKYYSLDGSFRYGYYYRYENGSQLLYKMSDSLLFRKTTFLKGENIEIHSEYDENGKIKLKDVNVYDDDMRWLLETRFQKNRMYVQYRYEYIENKAYITHIKYDKNGTKSNEERYLDEEKLIMDNKIVHYTRNGSIDRIDSFNSNNKLIKIEFLDDNGKLTIPETYQYNKKGQLIKHTKIGYLNNKKTIYYYKYDKLNRIKVVTKEFENEKETFKYAYETW